MAGASSGAPLAPFTPFCIFSGFPCSIRPRMRTTIGNTVTTTSEWKFSMMIPRATHSTVPVWHEAYDMT